MITLKELKEQGYTFFTGVPDSLLSPLIKDIQKSMRYKFLLLDIIEKLKN